MIHQFILLATQLLYLSCCGSGGRAVPLIEIADIDTSTVSEAAPSDSASFSPPYKTIAQKRFWGAVSYHFNESGNHVICIQTRKKSGKRHPTARDQRRFFVYDLTAQKIVFEGEITDGNVSWENEVTIRVETIPGMVPTNVPHSYGYRLNIRSGEKQPLP